MFVPAFAESEPFLGILNHATLCASANQVLEREVVNLLRGGCRFLQHPLQALPRKLIRVFEPLYDSVPQLLVPWRLPGPEYGSVESVKRLLEGTQVNRHGHKYDSGQGGSQA